MPPEQNMNTMPAEKGNGAFVGSIIIIIVLIIGGIYLWKSSQGDSLPSTEVGTEESAGAEAELEAELEAMDLEALDEGI